MKTYEVLMSLAVALGIGFQVNVIDGRAVGEELVVTQTCNRITLDGLEDDTIEFDVVVVWRIANGKIAEGWDIPSVYNVRVIQSSPKATTVDVTAIG